MERSGDGGGRGQGCKDGRIAPRRRQLKSAVLIFNDSASLMDCTLRNISDTGAGVECENTQQIPDNVVLKISGGETHDATVVWRTPTGLGLRFEENQDVKRLLAETSRLRTGLAEPITALLELANSSQSGEFGHPRVNTHLENIALKGKQFLDTLDGLFDER